MASSIYASIRQSVSMPLIARFMGPTWSPSAADRTQWTLIFGALHVRLFPLGFNVSAFGNEIEANRFGVTNVEYNTLKRCTTRICKKKCHRHISYFCWFKFVLSRCSFCRNHHHVRVFNWNSYVITITVLTLIQSATNTSVPIPNFGIVVFIVTSDNDLFFSSLWH